MTKPKKPNPKNNPPEPSGDRDEKGRFAKGNSLAGQGGRPKGSRHRISEAFLKDFHDDWKEHGAGAIKKAREKDPAQYVKIAASLLPKDINVTHSVIEQVQKMTDDELAGAISRFIPETAALLVGTGTSQKEGTA